MGGYGEFVNRGQYRLERVTGVFPEFRQGKALVRRAVVAETSTKNQATQSELTFIEGDISELAPLELAE